MSAAPGGSGVAYKPRATMAYSCDIVGNLPSEMDIEYLGDAALPFKSGTEYSVRAESG